MSRYVEITKDPSTGQYNVNPDYIPTAGSKTLYPWRKGTDNNFYYFYFDVAPEDETGIAGVTYYQASAVIGKATTQSNVNSYTRTSDSEFTVSFMSGPVAIPPVTYTRATDKADIVID